LGKNAEVSRWGKKYGSLIKDSRGRGAERREENNQKGGSGYILTS